MQQCFNTQPPEGGCLTHQAFPCEPSLFQHTATRRWLHSFFQLLLGRVKSFNTQPPEGGCINLALREISSRTFQHTATRRWLRNRRSKRLHGIRFNTQPPEGGCALETRLNLLIAKVSTHSHPKVAASQNAGEGTGRIVSTHSHPKVAASIVNSVMRVSVVSTHSHPKVAALLPQSFEYCQDKFQHTATRRWLPFLILIVHPFTPCFNTQPPEGGCIFTTFTSCPTFCFNTQPPEGGCVRLMTYVQITQCFNTQPPEGGCFRGVKGKSL